MDSEAAETVEGHDHTDAPKCPFCGHEETDAWEIDFGLAWEGDTEVSCGRCGKDYFCSRHCEVTFSSEPIKDKKP